MEDEAIHIIKTAAKIIRGEIRDAEYDVDFYPGPNHINDNIKGKEWLPSTLQVFIYLITSNLKQVSLGTYFAAEGVTCQWVVLKGKRLFLFFMGRQRGKVGGGGGDYKVRGIQKNTHAIHTSQVFILQNDLLVLRIFR